MSTSVTTILSVIQENTFTVADMQRRLGLLRQCIETSLFTESDIPFLEVCTNNLLQEKNTEDAQAVIAWGETVLTSFTHDTVGTKMSAIQTAIDDLPVLTLYIPTEFPSEEIRTIGQWCRAQCDASLLMNVHIDPDVVGGCAFVWNDAYHEFSFRTRIKEHVGIITTTLSDYAK